MGYLDTGTTVIDVKLTQRGRELLGVGKFKVTKFAFGDSEIDYSTPTGVTFAGPADSMVLEAPFDPPDIKSKLFVSGSKPTGDPYLSLSTSNVRMGLGDERNFSIQTFWPPLDALYEEEYTWVNLGPGSDEDIVLTQSEDSKTLNVVATQIAGIWTIRVKGHVSGAVAFLDIQVVDE